VVADERPLRPFGLSAPTNSINTIVLEAAVGNKTDRAKGGAKRAAGAVTGDDELKEQGRRDQAKGNVKASAKKAKEAVKKL
jgi:uncharacterized protein YjbJ (UPF0337 family)